MNFKEFCKEKAEGMASSEGYKLLTVFSIVAEAAEEYAQYVKKEALQQQRKEEKKKTTLQKIKEVVEV